VSHRHVVTQVASAAARLTLRRFSIGVGGTRW
jgi:hypothetical protein